MKKIILLAIIPLLLSCEPEKTNITDISWIEGTWAREFNGVAQVESWKLEESALIGSSYFITQKDTTVMQNLEIGWTDENWTYTQEDIGFEMSTNYVLQNSNSDSMVFANTVNQWPQVIVYKNVSPTKLDITITGNKVNDPKRTTFNYLKVTTTGK